jgi:hypothetical protein
LRKIEWEDLDVRGKARTIGKSKSLRSKVVSFLPPSVKNSLKKKMFRDDGKVIRTAKPS